VSLALLVSALLLAPGSQPPPEIAVASVDRKELVSMRRNQGRTLRLISVWATWCGPCVIELSDLMDLQRAYGGLRFEVVTVSVDEPASREDVLSVLVRRNVALRNAQFAGKQAELAGILDPSWDGGLPFALLVAPGGRVLFKNEGTLQIDGLKKAIEGWLRTR
jgi:thiol-disulfide isomerase/thioredoxin